jgi:Uma2 family endonuclease
VKTVPSGRRGRFPDASITGEREGHDYFVEKPVVLFEILSPDSLARDRDEKLEEYQAIPSVQHYVLIAQDRIRAEHYRRIDTGWHYRDLHGPEATLRLDPPGVGLRLGELYEGVEPAPTG